MSGDVLAAMAREVASLVAPLVRQDGIEPIMPSISTAPVSVPTHEAAQETTAGGDQDKTRANAKKTVLYFKNPDG